MAERENREMLDRIARAHQIARIDNRLDEKFKRFWYVKFSVKYRDIVNSPIRYHMLNGPTILLERGRGISDISTPSNTTCLLYTSDAADE